MYRYMGNYTSPLAEMWINLKSASPRLIRLAGVQPFNRSSESKKYFEAYGKVPDK